MTDTLQSTISASIGFFSRMGAGASNSRRAAALDVVSRGVAGSRCGSDVFCCRERVVASAILPEIARGVGMV